MVLLKSMKKTVEQIMNERNAQEYVKALLNLAEYQKRRLENGKYRRYAMGLVIQAKEKPVGPRAEWLRDTAKALVKTLQEQAIDFNGKNFDDAISVNDMIDGLLTGINLLKSTSEEKVTKDDYDEDDEDDDDDLL